MPHTKRRRTRGRRPARTDHNNNGGGAKEKETEQRSSAPPPPPADMPQPPDNFLRRLLDNLVAPVAGAERAARRRAASDDRRPLRQEQSEQQSAAVAAPGAGRSRRAKTQTKHRRTRHRRNKNMVQLAQRAATAIGRPEVARRQVYCRLAHGGPVLPIGDVANLSDLYYKIGREFGLAEGGGELLYCTVGGAQCDYDADRVVGTATAAVALPPATVLTAFVLGERKLVTAAMRKSSGSDEFGVTVADNGVGRLYVKRVKAGSFAAQLAPALRSGDAIVELNGRPTKGLAHYALAKMLRELADGAEFSIKLCGPLMDDDKHVASSPLAPVPLPVRLQQAVALRPDQTVRYRAEASGAHGALTVVAADTGGRKRVLTAVTKLIDDYLGVEDDELANAFVQHGLAARDPLSYSASVQSSPSLQHIGLPQALLYDIYGVVRDWQRTVADDGGGGEPDSSRARTADDAGQKAAAGPSSSAMGKIEAMFDFLDDDEQP